MRKCFASSDGAPSSRVACFNSFWEVIFPTGFCQKKPTFFEVSGKHFNNPQCFLNSTLIFINSLCTIRWLIAQLRRQRQSWPWPKFFGGRSLFAAEFVTKIDETPDFFRASVPSSHFSGFISHDWYPKAR